ncbi:hypothetical protein SDRG_08420 [Saprolegnia diclina VS20]|uniref:Calcium release-activated calcium channel protein 1 n=1 Tax=Saprolegnia diclina (strain VS20) TaxID=1156394 RepID=T0RV14_SAPDV|nr:hypothetical protein SDRG_08420 [Saprolegnia diclina VS20]EQC34217.1 hypothetical protein SDRG_08420 [Saprolegnia diclina VS20]|eukprot:XP_008612529.1 hypothetical protein SDRG_08420 [Saprolegnia diclina VS20]
MNAVVGAMMGSYDLQNAQRWRTEDMEHRKQEIQWREDDVKRQHAWRLEDIERERRLQKLENERRVTDARSEQLSAVSNLSALLGGFAMVANVEINLPDDVAWSVMFLYGTVSASVILCMLCCMLMCTLLLLAITRYASLDLENDLRLLDFEQLDVESPFYVWWLKRCEKDWQLAYGFFRVGIFLFLWTVALVGWVQFERTIYAGIGMSTISFLSFVFWQVRMESKWRYLLESPEGASVPPSYQQVSDEEARLRTRSLTELFERVFTTRNNTSGRTTEPDDRRTTRYGALTTPRPSQDAASEARRRV